MRYFNFLLGTQGQSNNLAITGDSFGRSKVRTRVIFFKDHWLDERRDQGASLKRFSSSLQNCLSRITQSWGISTNRTWTLRAGLDGTQRLIVLQSTNSEIAIYTQEGLFLEFTVNSVQSKYLTYGILSTGKLVELRKAISACIICTSLCRPQHHFHFWRGAYREG